MNDPETIAANSAVVTERIRAAGARAGRTDRVTLVAVTKRMPLAACEAAVAAGIADLGENYIKELRDKAAALPGVRWHYLGPVQSHTAAAVADNASVVHALGSPKAADRLSRRTASAGKRLTVLVQVDFTGARNGVVPAELEGFLDQVAAMEGLSLRGLMTLPPMTQTAEGARPYFARLRELRERLRGDHPGLEELSMGMSLDYEVAVEEGATMVRVGTALFGERDKR